MNQYQKDNDLQVEYDKTKLRCLCTMRETCDDCNTDNMQKLEVKRSDIIKEAIKQNYQLYDTYSIFKPVPVNYNSEYYGYSTSEENNGRI